MEQIKFNTIKEIYKIIKIDFNYPITFNRSNVMILKHIIITEIKYKIKVNGTN
jgi:hypothetical protein